MTSRKYWELRQGERREAYKISPEDGPLLAFLKWLFGQGIWHTANEQFISYYIDFSDYIESKFREKSATFFEKFIYNFLIMNGANDSKNHERSARADFCKGVEWFWISFSLTLIFLYWIAVWTCRNGNGSLICMIILTIIALVAIYRITDLVATTFRLHVLGDYETNAPPHALVMTFLAYVNILLCYGILYLAEAYWADDKFTPDVPLWSNAIDAAYFSAVTITTLGFGDLSPKRWPGKILVVSELFVGLILIVITFQRAWAGAKYEVKGGNGSPKTSNSDRPNSGVASSSPEAAQ